MSEPIVWKDHDEDTDELRQSIQDYVAAKGGATGSFNSYVVNGKKSFSIDVDAPPAVLDTLKRYAHLGMRAPDPRS